MPSLYEILAGQTTSGSSGFAVVVPDDTTASRIRAARKIWDAHVGITVSFSEFNQLVQAGELLTWYRIKQSESTPDESTEEYWGADGDPTGDSIFVIWYLDDDIPGSYTWE